MAAPDPTLYLLDGHAQLYRAYHTPAHANRRATDQTPTGALYGFVLQLRALRAHFQPELLGCVFDPKGPLLREREYAGYKAQRPPMPEDLRQQVPLAFEVCRGYGIPALQAEGYEADDVLGALAVQAVARGFRVVVVSSDKDLLQLVTDRVSVFDPDPNKEILYDPEKVKEVKGLAPGQIVDWLGLMGDATDNIPGVTGVGSQTALKLLQEHGSLDKVLAFYQSKFAHLAQPLREFVTAHQAEAAKEKSARKDVKPPKGVRVVEAYLFAQADQARASRELARLRLDVPVPFNPETFRCRPADRSVLGPLFARLDFRQFLRELGGAESAAPGGESSEPSPFAPEEDAGASSPDELLTASERKARDEGAQRTYRLVDTPAKLAEFARALAGQKRFAFDTETTSLEPRSAKLVGMSFAWSNHEGWYLAVRGPAGTATLSEEAALAACRGPLEDAAVAKIGQNAKYDLNVLRGHGLALRGLAFDTMLAGWLLDPAAPRHDLDSLAYAHLGLRKTPTASLIGKGKAASMDLAPVADVARYACEDALLAWQLAEALAPKLEAAGLTRLLDDVETPLVAVLADMEWTGVRVDVDLLRAMSGTLAAQLQAQEEEIYQLAGGPFAIQSPKQLGQVLFQKLGLASKVKTATGQDSTSEEVLTSLAREHPLPRLILEYRQFSKLKSTYVDALPELVNPATGRIHASFHQAGTETGRLSSSDPNLQNIPVRSELGRSIRAAFRPGPAGWKILSADYSQIELRMLAHFSQDPVLRESFAHNEDIHAAVAAQVFGVPKEQVTREQRARAKTVNFGVLYGQTAYGLAQTLSIPQREAQVIIDRFFSTHPRVRECLDGIIAGARKDGFVTTILGRRRFVPQLREGGQQEKFGERIAVNTVFQGSAADLIKVAMLAIHRALHEAKRRWQAQMILQIHDELLFECPAEEAADLGALVQDKMQHALELRVPVAVDVGVGDDWLNAKA